MIQPDSAVTAEEASQPGADDPRSVERSAWIGSVYESHARELWAVYYAQCADPDLARDALQEVFLRLHRQNRETLRDVKAWLIRVGRNWLRDVARRGRYNARAAEFLDDFAASQVGPLSALVADETQDRVRSCLRRLREEDRQVLVLRYALDWSSARIAETLDSTPSAVDMRLSRARRRLADQLREEGFSIPEGL